jgi:hypothetical protein
MKKFALVLLVISLSRIGVAYADTTNAGNSQNYFFGTKSAAANLNQVLALLVGPKGDPGPAGVAGKDGLIGMDGKDGKDGKNGLDGAPGAVGATGPAGPAGASVIAVAFNGAQGNCGVGGVRFTDGAGTVTYVCNGLNGQNGNDGKNGNDGVGGVGGGGTIPYGQGEVSVMCEADGKINVNFTRVFTGDDFVFSTFKVGAYGTDGDIKSTCASTNAFTTHLNFYFKIASSGLVNTSGHYLANDIVKCSYELPTATSWSSTTPQFTLDSSNTSCATIRSPGIPVALNEISTADYTDKIGFEIG